MANIFDYLKWRGDLMLENDPLNEVDALILSRLSYLPFDGIVSSHSYKKITVEKAAKSLLHSDKNMSMLACKEDKPLAEALSKSPRFKNLLLSGYENSIDEEKQMQFSVVTIELDKNTHFISFSGTDNSVVGWQEDFNLAHMFPLPSHIKALAYLQRIARETKGNLIIGGHSKGGNLAVYVSAYCSREIQSRIKAIYNNEGPGFDSKSIEQSGFKDIKDKIHTYLTQSSVIGMLFEHEENYTIIKSRAKGFFQHDIYTWEVMQNHLIHLTERTSTSVFFDHTITQLIADMTLEQRREFIEAVFSLINSCEDKNFIDIAEHWAKSSGAILKSFATMDKKTRNMVFDTLAIFVKCAKNNFSDINPLLKKRVPRTHFASVTLDPSREDSFK